MSDLTALSIDDLNTRLDVAETNSRRARNQREVDALFLAYVAVRRSTPTADAIDRFVASDAQHAAAEAVFHAVLSELAHRREAGAL